MATINDIKDTVDLNIRQKTLPGTITKTNHAAIEDSLAEELRIRGVVMAASTGELDEHSHENTLIILVKDIGLFVAVQTGDSPNGTTTFASFDSGWLWTLWAAVSTATPDVLSIDTFTASTDHTYTLASGYMIDLITIKPASTQTQKIGTTVGGDEILLEQSLTGNLMRAISVAVLADGSSVPIYFSGITANTTVKIYKRRLS